MKIKSTGYHITRIEATEDKISGRGGLAFILRYFEGVRIFKLIESHLGDLCRNKKGQSVGFIIRQIMAKFVDGTDTAISGFDRLKADDSYGAVIEVSQKDLLSSHAVKRFFNKFFGFKHMLLRRILIELFVWRLKIERPSIIILDLDTMVLDNDDAAKREGVDVTYKNKKGFQPLQISWRNKVIDAIFRRGNAHSNHKDDVQKLVAKIVGTIRNRYREDVPIIILSDSGFFDQKNFEYFEEVLRIFYVCTGKLYDSIKEHVRKLDRNEFKEFEAKHNKWEYCEFGSRLDSWKKFRRVLYTSVVQENDQLLLEFARPDCVFYTNIGMDAGMTKQLEETGAVEYLQASKIIEMAHSRGASELNHRSLKDFMGKEQLPFKRFANNEAYYHILLITHFLYECYKEDVTSDVLPTGIYPTTFRRRFIDFAAKVIDTGNRVILQVTKAVLDANKIFDMWRRCNNPIPLEL